jgi:undecaprenyl-diphosphatase
MSTKKNYILKDWIKAFSFVLKLDKAILKRLYSLNLHPKLNKVLRIFTRLGDGYIWVLPVIYIIIFHPLEYVIQGVRATAITSLFSLIVYKIIKNKVKRPRPFHEFDHVVAQVEPLDNYSFPSGHTMNNLTPGIMMGYYFPELAPFTIGFPLMWGFLRIYFGVHYFSDVIGGIIFSFLCVGAGKFIDSLIPHLSM